MSSRLHDLRFALRALRRSPGFTVAAVLTLALGIGLATAVFTVANAVLLRPLGVRDQNGLVVASGESADHKFGNVPMTPATAREFARGARTISGAAVFAYYGTTAVPIRDGDRITPMRLALVSGDNFAVLGSRATVGRTLEKSDDVEGAAPVAVLSYSAWQQRFGGDAHVVGREIEMYESGRRYAIVGVLQRGLDFPQGVEVWTPIATSLPSGSDSTAEVDVIARLAPGATATSVAAELTVYLSRSPSVWMHSIRGVARPFPQVIVGDVRPALLIFVGAVALLLLMTCVNVANLLLVRGLARAREVAVRSALGAARTSIVLQLFTENLLLAVSGGTLGAVTAAVAVRGFVAFAPAGLPRLDEVRVDPSALVAALGITLIAVLIFGLAPAIATSRVELQRELRSDARQSASRRSRRVADALVVGQVAIALVVLCAAGVIARTLLALEHADLVLEPSHVLVAELALRSDGYDSAPKQLAMLERLLPAIEAIPGVQAASPVVAVPFAGTAWAGRPAAEGQSPEQAAQNPWLNMEVVAPDYFSTLGISVVRGRHFAESDREGSLKVTMLSEAAARYYWPGQDPIGKHVGMGGDLSQQLTVVGIVANTRYRDLREARPTIYFPLRQSFFPYAPANLVIRTSGRPSAVLPALKRTLSEVAPGVTIASAAPFESFLDKPLSQPRLNAFLLAVFAAAAVALAAIGLFGVIAAMVRQRTRELGLRVALGATAWDIQSMILRRGLTLAATGTVAGLSLAFVLNRLLEGLLYQVSPTDATTLVVATILVLGVAWIASVIPARASTRIDPVIALRSD